MAIRKLSSLTRDHSEGSTTKMIEQRTAKIPSGFFLTAGISSAVLSLSMKVLGRDETANFIGMWTPTFLILGLYNKLVKLEGSE